MGSMNRSTTAREALVAELIGDVAMLLDRVETLTPAMTTSRQALAQAAAELAASVAPFEARITAWADHAQTRAAQHVVDRTNAVAALSFQEQKHAMSEAARLIFNNEVTPPLRSLVAELHQAIEEAHRPWDLWLTHASTAAASACLTFFAVSRFWCG